MFCWFCAKAARGTCRFCGRGTCEDHARFGRSWEAAQELLETPPFRQHAARWLEPEPDLRAHLLANLAPAHHQSGTCRMGLDARDSVVGPDLRVHGLTGLLVADSSVFPDTVMHNTNLACYMVGEVAADLIRRDRGSSLR